MRAPIFPALTFAKFSLRFAGMTRPHAEPTPAGGELPLFLPPAARSEQEEAPIDLAREVIDRDLSLWEGLRRRVEVNPGLRGYQRTITDLGRDLRSLRDCYLAASHPRVRQALLRESGAITRRMKALGKRFRVRGLDVVPVSAVS